MPDFFLEPDEIEPERRRPVRMVRILDMGPAGAFKQEITVSRFLPFHPPYWTYGREPVIRPHFGVLSAVSYAVLEFRTGNPS